MNLLHLLILQVILNITEGLIIINLLKSGKKAELGFHSMVVIKMKKLNYQQWRHLIDFYLQIVDLLCNNLFIMYNDFYTIYERKIFYLDLNDLILHRHMMRYWL